MSRNTRETNYLTKNFATELYENLSMGQLYSFKIDLDLKGLHNLTLGSEKYLPRSVGNDVMNKEGEKIWYIMESFYKPYTIIFYGIPVRAEKKQSNCG